MPSPASRPVAVPRAPLAQHFPAGPPPRDEDFEQAALVAQVVAFAFGLKPQEIAGAARARAEVARARHVAIYLSHVALGWSLGRVASAFGRDRTTAGYACGRVEDARDDAEFDAALNELEAWLRAAPPGRRLAQTADPRGAA